MKSRSWVLYTLAIVNFTHIVDSMIIMPLGDNFIETFGLSAGEFSVLVSAYAFAAAFSSLIAIFYLDVFDRKTALVFLYTGFAVGTLLCSFATSYIMLLCLRILTGFFGGVIGALALSVLSDLYPFKERGYAMGVLMMGFSAAAALGIPLGLYLAALDSWELPFKVLGGFGLFLTVIILFTFPKMNDHLAHVSGRRTFANTFGKIFGDINQRDALIAGFFLIIGHFLIIPFISPYMMRNLGLTQFEISYMFFFGGAATVISSPLIGKLTDKYGVMKVFGAMMLLSFVPTLLITHISDAELTTLICINVFFFVTATGRMIPPQTMITATAPIETRGSFMSLKSSLQQLAIGIAALTAGQIIFINEDGFFQNYNWVAYLSIAFCIVTVFLINRLSVAKDN